MHSLLMSWLHLSYRTSRFVSNGNLGSAAGVAHPDQALLKAQRAHKLESRGRGHFGLTAPLRLSRNARGGCNSSYADCRLAPIRMASATPRLSTEGRSRTYNTRNIPERSG